MCMYTYIYIDIFDKTLWHEPLVWQQKSPDKTSANTDSGSPMVHTWHTYIYIYTFLNMQFFSPRATLLVISFFSIFIMAVRRREGEKHEC